MIKTINVMERTLGGILTIGAARGLLPGVCHLSRGQHCLQSADAAVERLASLSEFVPHGGSGLTREGESDLMPQA